MGLQTPRLQHEPRATLKSEGITSATVQQVGSAVTGYTLPAPCCSGRCRMHTGALIEPRDSARQVISQPGTCPIGSPPLPDS